MKQQPANKNQSDFEQDSFQKNFFLQKYIRTYLFYLHLDQLAYIRKKFEVIEESLLQEINKSFENHFRLFQQKRLRQKIKTFRSSMIAQLCKVLNLKKYQFWKISSLKFSFGYEEIISLFLFLGLIGIIVLGSLLNPTGPQFLMPFY